ncbi:nitroreductase/quinone reductase family protein [Georgenia sp. AZ-5]|uniref:nitroreductase/quinone reductase family protein n=1 Tax=Georgenia sp. AZ-5 TaxID=3367526 RepID=UPI003754B67B
MPRDTTLKALNAAHLALLRVSRGLIGWHVAGMPVLELTTTGRRSGRPHRVMLTSPVQLGAALVVVASRGGDDRPPGWLLNVRADPVTRVVVQGRPAVTMLARVATPGERDRLWPRVVARYPGYARYQSRTARRIDLVVLEPQERAA